MADLGDVGRGLLKGAKGGADAVQDRLKRLRSDDDDEKPASDAGGVSDALTPSDGVRASLTPPAELEDDEPDEQATEEDVRELVSLMTGLLAARRPPPGPIAQPWELGVGDLLAEHPKVPDRLRGVVRKLDRFGGVAVNPEQVGFDGDEIDWDQVTEVRMRHVVDFLYADAALDQLKSLPLPWFPGRKRLALALGKATLTLAMVTLEDQLTKVDADLRVPAEIEYRGALRIRRTMSPGVIASLVLLDPAVKGCIVATAQARGIPVRATGDEMLDDASRRAEAVKAKLEQFERFRRAKD